MRHGLTLIAVLALLFFFGLGSTPLLDPDEGRHAEVAREMLASGNWLTLRFNAETYAEKPAGFYWILAAAFRFLGPNEWSARLPSAVAAMAAVLLTFVVAHRVYGTRVAFLASVVLSTSALHLATAHLVLPDMTFSALLTASLVTLRLWMDRPTRTLPVAAYLLVGLATLLKGPVAVILAAATLALHGVVTRDRFLVRDLRPLYGAGIVLAVAAPWYVTAALADPDYMFGFLWRSNVLRFFAVGRIGKPEPIVYYAYILPAACLPWAITWPAAFASARRRSGQERAVDPFFLCWVVAVVGFFSLSRSKLPTYVLPALPPISILFAHALVPYHSTLPPQTHRLGFAGACLWTTLLALTPSLAAFFLPDEAFAARPALLLATAAALPSALVLRFLRWPEAWIVAMAASVAGLALHYGTIGGPILARYRSGAVPGRLIARALPPEGCVTTFRFRSNSLRFYSGRIVERLDSLETGASLLSRERPVVAALRTWDRQLLPKLLTRRVWVWWREPGSHRMIVSNLPPRDFPGDGWIDPSGSEARAGSVLRESGILRAERMTPAVREERVPGHVASSRAGSRPFASSRTLPSNALPAVLPEPSHR